MAYKDPSAGEARESTQVEAVADLNQDISASYTEAEIQAISDKIDELLAALRAANILAS